MIIAKPAIDSESEQVYQHALTRLEKELGWVPSQAHEAMANLAASHGVFLDDVALAVIDAPTIKCGLGQALRRVVFDRRPLRLR